MVSGDSDTEFSSRKRKNIETDSYEGDADSHQSGASFPECPAIKRVGGGQRTVTAGSTIQYPDMDDTSDDRDVPSRMNDDVDPSAKQRLFDSFPLPPKKLPLSFKAFRSFYADEGLWTADGRDRNETERIMGRHTLNCCIRDILAECKKVSWEVPDQGRIEAQVNNLNVQKAEGLATTVAGVLMDSPKDPEDLAYKLQRLLSALSSLSHVSSPPRQSLRVAGLYDEEQKNATVEAWSAPYQGSMHDALWHHIKGLHEKPDGYANTCAIIQSSGSGKSRTVDQLSVERIVIPICLRDPSTNGFPPSDTLVRSYLLESMRLKGRSTSDEVDEGYAQRRLDAFFVALFEMTLTKLKTLSSDGEGHYKMLAGAFRKAMTEGQQFSSPNQFRTDFYREVVNSAKILADSATCKNQGLIGDVQIALKKLSAHVFRLEKKRPGDPRIIVAFDESSVLTEFPNPLDKRITPVLDILRSRLSLLINHTSLFTLFLSTMGQIATFQSPQGLSNSSNRIIQRVVKLHPAFTGCIFDGFALTPPDNIDTAATEWYMMHLGRPLWATRLQLKARQPSFSPEQSSAGSGTSQVTEKRDSNTFVRKFAMHFVVGKLLNISGDELENVTDIHGLACLAQRLPIEFLSTAYVSQKTLVEHHMRICLRVDPEEQTMITSSTSEPILSEAAFVAMQRGKLGKLGKLNVLRSLENAFKSFSAHQGDRGELIGNLLLLLARDDAVAKQNGPGMCDSMSLRPSNEKGEAELTEWNRVIKVPDFIRSLFVEDRIKPNVLEALDNHFGDTYIHFNHFLKSYDKEIAAPNFLLGLLARGAGLSCANNQPGVDSVIPCLEGKEMKKESIRQILAQFKDRQTDRKSENVTGFNEMDPVSLGIAVEPNAPVIRIFFELGCSSELLFSRVKKERPSEGSYFPAIDFYCAGISPDYLKPIAKRQADDAWTVGKWKGLLDSKRDWDELYKPPVPSSNAELDGYPKKMTPGVAKDKEFWSFFPEVIS